MKQVPLKQVPPKQYTIPGKPVPLARPRFGSNRVYDCQKHLRNSAGIVLANQHANAPLYTGPVLMRITFTFAIPKQTSKKNRERQRLSFHYKRPDLSNLIKFVEDVGHGILWDDDCIISVIHAQKTYHDDAQTTFSIKPLE